MKLDSPRALAIVIGASRFPGMESIDREALAAPLARAASEMVAYFSTFCTVLDLFDQAEAEDLAVNVVQRIVRFVDASPTAQDIFLYYVGHGAFTRRQEYYLCLRNTDIQHLETTALFPRQIAESLRHVVKRQKRRVVLVLDCCFAAAAMDWFIQSNTDELRTKRFARLGLPSGFGLMCAASRDSAAAVLAEGALPIFTEKLLEVVRRGVVDRKVLTLREALSAVDQLIVASAGEQDADSLRPELHISRPRAQSLADVPLLPAIGQGVPLQIVDLSANSLIHHSENHAPTPPYVAPTRSPRSWMKLGFGLAVAVGIAAVLAIVDIQKAYEYAACWMGSARGCTNYGVHFTDSDSARAVQYYHYGCTANDQLGCAYYAYMMKRGMGLPKDVFGAVAIYREACSLNEQFGCAELAACYANGEGVERDVAKAIDLASHACSAAEPRGCEFARQIRETGRVTRYP